MPKNARAILPDTSNVPLDLSCVTIARRDFTVLIIHTCDALKFEINTFIQPFANFIKRCLSRPQVDACVLAFLCNRGNWNTQAHTGRIVVDCAAHSKNIRVS